jgi:hypothetical protein
MPDMPWIVGVIGVGICVIGAAVRFASHWLPHRPGSISPVQRHTRTAGQIAFVIGMLLALISQILQKIGFH